MGDDVSELVDYFGIEGPSELAVVEFSSSMKTGRTIYALIDVKYNNDIELADKVVYFEMVKDKPSIVNVLRRRVVENANSQIEISFGLNMGPTYVIEYDLERGYTNLIQGKGDFEACFDSCMHDLLDGIFNQGSWLRRARFIASAPVEMAWHIADCSIYCL